MADATTGRMTTADAGDCAVQAALADYAEAARGAFAANTERAIRSDTAIFAAWCTTAGRGAQLPVPPSDVAEFIDAMAEVKAPATVRRYVASLNMLHRAAQLPPPGSDEIVRLAIRRMNVARGTRQKQARGATWLDIERALDAMDGGPTDLRDGALLSAAYDTMARISELSALNVCDLTFHGVDGGSGDGVALIRRSKADQEGQGSFRYLSRSTCRRLQSWIAVAGLQPGDPVFIALSNRSASGRVRIRPRDIARVFQRRIGAAGISGHSLRVGATQDAIAANLDFPSIQRAGGWSSPAMPMRYGERLIARQSATARLAALQRR